jgi:tight adherence protein C
MFETMQTFLPVLTFIAVSVLGISAFIVYETRRNRRWIGKRLRFSQEKSRVTDTANLFLRVLLALGSHTAPTNKKELSKVRKELSYAGYRGSSDAYFYYGIRALSALGLAIVSLLFLALFSNIGLRNLLLTFLPAGIGYYLPQIILKAKIKARNKKIFRELPDTLDLLVICIEAGLGFEMALFRVSKELKDVAPVLSKEFAQYFFETRGGVSRNEALVNLKNRNDSEGLRSVIDVVIQSFRFGTDVASALRVHSESMRTERRQIAEEKGAKVAVKLTLPLVLLILPALLIIILGPAILRLIGHFSG